MLKICFYYNHYTTLGHSLRIFSLVKGLKERFRDKINICVIQSGKRQKILPFNKYSALHILPYSIGRIGFLIEENYKIYQQMILNKQIEKMLKERLSIMRDILNKFKPHIFITEYFPFGKEFWSFEIPYILEYIRDNLVCKIVSSCGYLNYIKDTYNFIRDFYDILLIHSPKEFSKDYHLYLHKEAKEKMDTILKDFSDKLHFTGFIFDNFSARKWKQVREKYLREAETKGLILVSRGGGIVNKKIIISSIMAAQRLNDLFFIISCGPATGQKEFNDYNKIAKGIKNVEIRKVIYPDFESYLEASDLSINMSGYNTIVRLLYYNKKTIIVPYYTYEQRWRADLANRYLHSEIIPTKDLTISTLTKAISQLFYEKKVKDLERVDYNWFSGISQTIKIIKCLV